MVKDKGTNRRQFIRGEVDKYSWIDKGSSYLASEFQAAFLFYQLKNIADIHNPRLRIWKLYHESMKDLEEMKFLKRPVINKNQKHNAHIYYIMLKNKAQRDNLKQYLNNKGVSTATHYAPLHNSKAGKKFGKFYVKIENAHKISTCSLRLPIFHGMKISQVKYVVNNIKSFFNNDRKN